MSADPGNAGADPMNPQSWNGYGYVNNSPLINVDPDGMQSLGLSNVPKAGSGFGFSIGLGIGQAVITPGIPYFSPYANYSSFDATWKALQQKLTALEGWMPALKDARQVSNAGVQISSGPTSSDVPPQPTPPKAEDQNVAPVPNNVSIACQAIHTGVWWEDAASTLLGFQHCWVETSTKKAGMGPANPGPLPGNPFGIPTRVVDESARSGPKTIIPVPNADEACVNARLQIGSSCGRWGLTNNCNTFALSVVAQCGASSRAWGF
jgi:hypothetical protein